MLLSFTCIGGMGCQGRVHYHSHIGDTDRVKLEEEERCQVWLRAKLEHPSTFWGNIPHPRVGKRRGHRKRTRAKKAMKTLPAKSTNIGAHFADIGLNVEEQITEEHPPMKKKKIGAERK